MMTTPPPGMPLQSGFQPIWDINRTSTYPTGGFPGYGMPLLSGYGPMGHTMTKKQRRAYAQAMGSPYGGNNNPGLGGGNGPFGSFGGGNNNNNGGNLNQRMDRVCNYFEWKTGQEQHEQAEKAGQAEIEKERAEETARWATFSDSIMSSMKVVTGEMSKQTNQTMNRLNSTLSGPSRGGSSSSIRGNNNNNTSLGNRLAGNGGGGQVGGRVWTGRRVKVSLNEALFGNGGGDGNQSSSPTAAAAAGDKSANITYVEPDQDELAEFCDIGLAEEHLDCIFDDLELDGCLPHERLEYHDNMTAQEFAAKNDCAATGSLQEWCGTFRALTGARAKNNWKRREVILRCAYFSLERLHQLTKD